MTLPLSKEQIEAIQARAEDAHTYWFKVTEFHKHARTDIPALCKQALWAVGLKAGRDSWRRVAERLQSELTAARNALEEERERCAKAVLESGTNGFMNEFEANCAAIVIRKLPSQREQPTCAENHVNYIGKCPYCHVKLPGIKEP